MTNRPTGHTNPARHLSPIDADWISHADHHTHRWGPWRRTGVLGSVERRRCQGCPWVQTRPTKQRPAPARRSECPHEWTDWAFQPGLRRNRKERQRGAGGDHRICLLCGLRAARDSWRGRADGTVPRRPW